MSISKVIHHKENTNSVEILPGVLYNNHGLSYHPEFRTKHMLTGLWGREALNNKDSYMEEMKKYGGVDSVTIENFDFYKDYTYGGYLTKSSFDLNKVIEQKQVEFIYD